MLLCPVPLAAAALSDTGARAERALLSAACTDTSCALGAQRTRGAPGPTTGCLHPCYTAIKTVPKRGKFARRHGDPRSGLWRPKLLAIAHSSYLNTNRIPTICGGCTANGAHANVQQNRDTQPHGPIQPAIAAIVTRYVDARDMA